MAATLRTKALERSVKTNSAAYYSYVDDSKNPVLQSFEAQITDFKNYVAKQQKSNQSIDGRLSETLFQLWSAYQPRITVRMYCEKLMHLGEFLVAHEKYNIALFQCYQRYLNEFGSFHMEDFETVDEIEEKFFPNGLSDVTADISFRALMGCALCLFYLAIEQDPKVQLDETLDRCLVTLAFIRLLMSVALKDDRWSWLIYNGTIYLYKMSRYLMILGYSLQVVDYLVWAAVSTEMCLPLMSISYLPWRSTLYCAACEAFYDTRVAPDGEKAIAGENFARRALEQFKNLHELQSISVEGDTCQQENSFRYATIKIATMIFKRMVFESRRKAKGVLRPKVRQDYSDLNGPWPRTLTEKLLSDMFDCRCAQFLAILQALSDSNRRLVLASPAASEQEIEILDVTVELFYAAQYILQVKHANLDQIAGANENSVYPNVILKQDASLLDLAVNGQYVIPLPYVLQLLKLSFNYQVYEIFAPLMEPISELIERDGGSQTAMLALLQILYEIERCEKERKAAQIAKNQPAGKGGKDGDKKKQRTKSPSKGKDLAGMKKSPGSGKMKLRKPKAVQDLLNGSKGSRTNGANDVQVQIEQMTDEEKDDERSLEELLEDLCFLLLNDPDIQAKIEPDVLIDVSLLLWNKCRPVLRRLYNEPNENQRWLTRLDHDPVKWIHLCFQTHEIMSRFNFATVDSSAYAELSLRLGQVLFALIQPSAAMETTIRANCYKQRVDELRTHLIDTSAKPLLQSYTEEFKRLQAAQETTSHKENKSGKGPAHSAHPHSRLDGDTAAQQYPLIFFAEQFLAQSLKILAQARSNLIRFDGSSMFDRNWSSKSADNDDESDTLSQTRFLATQPFQIEKGHTSKLVDNLIKDLDAELNFVYCRVAALLERIPDARALKKGPIDQYLNDARGNSHKKALLCAAYATTRKDDDAAAEYMQKAYKHLSAAEEEDRLYYWHHQNQKSEKLSQTAVPRPFIVARAPDFVFVMAPDFGPFANKVATYRIFCRAADRPNAKARMADTSYPGTGQQIPASFIKPVKISGLDPDLKYVFSMAMYDINGQLIGESVSESTEPILAAHPISLLFIRCLLSQVSFEIKQFTVAKKVFHSLWTYFVRTPSKIESSIRDLSTENPLITYELRYSRVADSSISLLQKFINSIFINVEIFIKENHLYCDMITPTSSNRANQISRIRTCSEILMALELSCWLNDFSYALQSVIYLYGLLTPLIFSKIYYPSIYQIFEKCLSVVEEASTQISKQRSRVVQENIYHMIICISYYMSQYLQQNDEIKLSHLINQIAKKFLSSSSAPAQIPSQTNEFSGADQGSTADLPAQVELSDEIAEQLIPKMHHSSVHNEELKALERFVAREKAPHSILTGSEEPSIVYTFINSMTARQGYKEVLKFRKRTAFMEYLVQVFSKSLAESTNDDLLSWYDDNQTFTSKRNDLLLGPWRTVITKGEGIIAIAGSNENKYAAALTEFSPERKKKQQSETPRKQGSKKKQATVKKMLRTRPTKYHYLIPPNTPEAVRLELEQRQRPAIDKLFNLLPDLYHQRQARKKFRRFITDELVWRSQYESLNGLYCLERLPLVIRESSDKIQALLEDGRYRFDRINPNLFTYDQTDLIIRNVTDDEILDDHALEQKFEFNFSQSEVKDRVEIINDLIIGQISDSSIYLNKKSDEAASSTRDRKQISPNRQSQSKKPSPSSSPRREVSELHRQKTDPGASDPFGFRRVRAYIDRFYLHYRRSIVLAHRSNNWTLLQNVTKVFYDGVEQLISYLSATTLNKIFSLNALLAQGYQTMFLASELLLDMLYRSKPFYDNNNDKLVNKNTNKLNQWFTHIDSSWTSSTFNFEQSQDRNVLLDLRFVRKFMLRALHTLYVATKWEKLGTIAIKFNALSDHYFADFTSPLLIAAQTALLQQLRDRQSSIEQPHFDATVADLGRPIHPDDFYTLRPEKLFRIINRPGDNFTRTHSASTLSLGARLDPKGTDFYAQTTQALELISIPLDVEFSRKLLRQALDKTYYSSRSIIQCRKMLAFYIYKQEQHLAKDFLIFTPIVDDVPAHTENVPTKKETISTLHCRPLTAGEAMDFSATVNNHIDTSPSAEVSRETVIDAYQTLSKLLLGQNRRDEYCQVVTELGDLYFHCEKNIESKTAWCDVMDTILDGRDVIITWFKNDALRNLLTNRTQLLQKCGVWGCLMGAIVTSKLAKYHIHINCDQHLQTCLLTSYFLRAIFFYTLPHSEHDIDYATFIIDHAIHVWPGIQLTSDEFRLNPRALMDALAYTCDALVRHDICLHTLPVLALYDVFALHCRNVQHTVQSRLIRLRALIQLDLFSEAHIVIQMLLDGQKLPCTALPGHYRSNFIDPNSLKTKPQYFDSTKNIISDYNLGVLDALLTAKLSAPVSRLYGSHLSIEFHYLLSLFYVRLAAKVPVVADLERFQELKQMATVVVPDTRSKGSVTESRITSPTRARVNVFQDESTHSFSYVKSYLIGTAKLFAEKCLAVLQQTEEMFRDYPSNLQSFEYQLLIDCLSLLSDCAHQCHLDQLAARYALEILKVLSMIGEDNVQEQKIASGSAKRKTNFPRLSTVSRYPRKKLNALNLLFNTRYSQHLTVYTWLKQRGQLCYFMLQQINTLGKVKGTDDHIREELANVHTYIEHGYSEAEQYRCESMQATFLLYHSLYNLSELVDIQQNIQRLNTALRLFQSALSVQQNNVLSIDLVSKQALTQILLWEHQSVHDLDGTALKLIEQKDDDRLQWPILDFLVQMGERVQMTGSSQPHDWFAIPIIPLNNLYSSLLLPLIFAKLRTATIIVDYAYRSSSGQVTMNDLLENAQTLFRQCLKLNRLTVERYVNIEYESLLHLARIDRLHKRTTLATSSQMPLKTIVQQLLDAIRLCYLSTNDSQFIQTCYFELALVLLDYTRVSSDTSLRKFSGKSLTVVEGNEGPTTPSLVERPSILKQRQSTLNAGITVANDTSRRVQQIQQLKQAASVAIRAATQMALNQKQRVQLPGLAEEFSDTAEVQWPVFLAADILGYYVFPERRRIFKSEAEREILTLAPHFESKASPESFDSKLSRLQSVASEDITWLHLLNYQNAVGKRIDNRQLLSFDCDAVGRSNLFFLHVLPRYVGVTQTLQSLSHYSAQCTAIYPSEIYSQHVLQIIASSTDKLPQRASTSSARTIRSAQTSASGMNLIDDEDLFNCPNIVSNISKRELPDHQPAVAFSLAWYSSNTVPITTAVVVNQRLSTIYGFYTTAKDDLVNVVAVPLDDLLNLYKKYLPIAQVAETDPKQISQNQIQPILQELFSILTGEKTSNDVETPSKKTNRLTDAKAYVELESFLNAKFGAQTSHAQLRDWFVQTLKHSSNTLLSTQD